PSSLRLDHLLLRVNSYDFTTYELVTITTSNSFFIRTEYVVILVVKVDSNNLGSDVRHQFNTHIYLNIAFVENYPALNAPRPARRFYGKFGYNSDYFPSVFLFPDNCSRKWVSFFIDIYVAYWTLSVRYHFVSPSVH